MRVLPVTDRLIARSWNARVANWGPQNFYPSFGICQGLDVTSGLAGDPDSGDY